MKILHVVPSFYPANVYGGPIESVYALCRHLVRQGCQVRVLTTDANGLDHVLDVAKDREVVLPGDVKVRYCRRVARHSISIGLLRRLPEYVRWADLVHLTAVYSFPTLPTLFACRIHGKPLVWSPRGALQRWPGSTKIGRKKIWHRICARTAPREFTLHVTSEEEARESQAVFPRARIRVIRNGVEVCGPVKELEKTATLRLLYLGRLDPKKGIENLLEAYASLQRTSQLACTLTIAGAGEPAYTQSLRDRIDALSLTGKVTMAGAVHDRAKETLLTNASIVVVPSHTENFAMVVAEALAHGVPVIASKGTPWHKIEENRCGLWVDNDPASLANAITRMATLPRTAMGQRGLEWMQREFSWDEQAKGMMRHYLSLSAPR